MLLLYLELSAPISVIRQRFQIDHITCDLVPREAFYPSQQVPVVIMHQKQTRLGMMTWGLVPSWAPEKKGRALFNARGETLAEKPSFRESFKKKRCLIIADGFFEWKTDPEDGRKTRYLFQLFSMAPFGFAGLWETWRNTYHGCTIITRDATDPVKEIHNRMPVILAPDDCRTWLDPSSREDNLLDWFTSRDGFLGKKY